MWKSKLLQASSKMGNGVFINPRQSKSVPSTLKSLGFTALRVHMTAAGSTEGMAEKVPPVLPSNERLMGRLDPVYDEVIKHVYNVQSARFYLPIEESGKGKTHSQITTPLPKEVKLLELMKEFSKLEEELGKLETMEMEHPETWGSGHEYGRKKMELLARVEPLYHEAKNYQFSVQYGWESFLISAILPKLEFQMKKRRSCDTETTDPLGGIPFDPSSQIPKNSDKILELNRLREAYPKISQIQANLAEFWKSTSFPLEPEYFLDEDLVEERQCLTNKLVCLLASAKQEYPDDVKVVASSSPIPEPGKYFDVVECLSRFSGGLIRNNGDRVPLNQDTFRGKHVLICCFHVPVFSSQDRVFQCLVNLCNELYSTRDDFEMVMVARMNRLANYPEVFHHFFSGFPRSCLAVPFEDKIRRDYACQVLGLTLQYNRFQCLLLNAEGIVSDYRMEFSDYEYGAEAFPFTEDIIDKMRVEQKAVIFEKEGNWLERVLRCNDSSPDYVYRFKPSGGPREELPISELGGGDRHVGIYLCCGEELCEDILAMFEQCREKQLDFEVVVVYMPFATKIDPKIFQEKIDGTLLKKHNVRGWWCLPFNNSVSLRFSRITEYYDYNNEDNTVCDKLIVVGPGVDRLDIYSDCVMRDRGIDAFPFSREAAVKACVNQFREITLESLFVDNEFSVFRGNNSSDSRKLGQLLQGKKKIILCIAGEFVPRSGCSDFKTLASIYNRSKADFEMVFVARPENGLEFDYENLESHEMPWYICPTIALNSTKLKQLTRLIAESPYNRLFFEDALIGFGEDGRVCSYQTVAKKTRNPSSQLSVVDTLCRDVKYMLAYNTSAYYYM